MKITFDEIAKVAHEVNKAYCEAIGDMSQPAWEDAPEWQKKSAVIGVMFHMSGNHEPEASHKLWLEVKAKDGWKYGPVKDPEKKEHPCMVPFHELKTEQKVKDYLFRGVVNAFKNI